MWECVSVALLQAIRCLLCQLLIRLGFDERISGSHHIFTKKGVEEILNLQPKQGKAKVYQVKQVREMLLKYQLGG
jgi:hypothetical protein